MNEILCKLLTAERRKLIEDYVRIGGLLDESLARREVLKIESNKLFNESSVVSEKIYGINALLGIERLDGFPKKDAE